MNPRIDAAGALNTLPSCRLNSNIPRGAGIAPLRSASKPNGLLMSNESSRALPPTCSLGGVSVAGAGGAPDSSSIRF